MFCIHNHDYSMKKYLLNNYQRNIVAVDQVTRFLTFGNFPLVFLFYYIFIQIDTFLVGVFVN